MMNGGDRAARISLQPVAMHAPGPAGLPFGAKDDMDTLVALHRRRMELMATLSDLPLGNASQDRLRIRQAANRLYFEIHRLDRRIRQQEGRSPNPFAEGQPITGTWQR